MLRVDEDDNTAALTQAHIQHVVLNLLMHGLCKAFVSRSYQA
jgi:hypothetical protein